ncbi:MAG: chitin deacetylase family protein [Chloroflexi bacterium]|nr:chitin deacetylase family protein [Chloroflexota bacterium]
MALTIDDGPDASTTPAILDLLQEHGSHATFFVITERIPGNERLMERMIEEGHELGNHMTSEEPSIRLSREGFAEDLNAADSALTEYDEIRWLRPGSGWFTAGMIDTVESRGYRMALGSVYPFDHLIPSSWFAAEFILWRIRPGDVIVLHDHRWRGERTADTLRRVLPELTARGYKVVTLSGLVDFSE